jgi:hypothetical protein
MMVFRDRGKPVSACDTEDTETTENTKRVVCDVPSSSQIQVYRCLGKSMPSLGKPVEQEERLYCPCDNPR